MNLKSTRLQQWRNPCANHESACVDHGYLRGEKKKLTRRRGERGELWNGSPWKKSACESTLARHSQGTTPSHHQQSPHLRASAPPRETNSRQMPPMSALAWITAIFEEKKRNSRGDGENAESCGTEVRGKNRPANPLWGRLSQGTTPSHHQQSPHLRASA